MKHVRIRLDEIDREDGTFDLFPAEPPPELVDSIRSCGFTVPVVLRRNTGRITVVDGFKRVRAAAQAAATEIVGILYGEDELPMRDALLLRAGLNSPSRRFTVPCKGALVSAAAAYGVSHEEIAGPLRSIFQVPPDPAIVRIYAGYGGLPAPLRQAVDKTGMNERTFISIAGMPEDEQRLMGELLLLLRANENIVRRLIDLTLFLAHFEGAPHAAVLADLTARFRRRGRDMDPKQITDAVMDELRSRANPRYTADREAFEKLISESRLPDTVAAAHAPYFEDDAVRLTVEFRTAAQLDDALGAIRGLIDSGTAEKITRIGRDNDQ